MSKSPRSRKPRPNMREWQARSAKTDIELRPGGRAILRTEGAGYAVEIHWQTAKRGRERELLFTSLEVIADGDRLPPLTNFEAQFYFYALMRRFLTAKEIPTGPEPRPQPGKAPPRAFYRQLVARYEELAKSGSKSPAAELARRMRVNPSTLKSWLSRGRRYLRDAERED